MAFLSRLLLALCVWTSGLYATPLADAAGRGDRGRARIGWRLRSERPVSKQKSRAAEKAASTAAKAQPGKSAPNTLAEPPRSAPGKAVGASPIPPSGTPPNAELNAGEFTAQGMGVSGPYPVINAGNSENMSAATDGQSVVMQANGKWAPETIAGGGASDLADLGDIDNAATATAGQALVAVGNGTDFTFDDVEGGAGSTIYAPDGTTEVTQTSTFNIVDFGGNPVWDHARANGGKPAAEDEIALDAGQGALFVVGNDVAIPGGGASHSLIAVTPTTPTVTQGNQRSLTFQRVSGNVITILNDPGTGGGVGRSRDFLGFGTGQTFTVDSGSNDYIISAVPLGIADGHPVYLETSAADLPAGLSVATPYYLRFVSNNTDGSVDYTAHTSRADAISGASKVAISDAGTGTHRLHVELLAKFYTSASDLPAGLSDGSTTTYALRGGPTVGSLRQYTTHPNMSDAASNSNVTTLSDAGTGTHSMTLVGALTANYRVVAHTPGGGRTVRSSAGQTTTSLYTQRENAGNWVCFPIASNSGTTASHYSIYSDRDGSTEKIIASISGVQNAWLVTFTANPGFVEGDIGKTLRYGGTDSGYLAAYDNVAQTAVVKLDRGGRTWPTGQAVTTTGGTGAGTTTGSPVPYMAWFDGGDLDRDYEAHTLALRTGREVQLVSRAGTPTGGTESWSYKGYQISVNYNDTASQVETKMRAAWPDCQLIEVDSVGSTPNFTYIVSFEWGDEYQLGHTPQIKVFSSLTGGTSPTISVGTVNQGESYLPGNIVTYGGNFYECRYANGRRAGSDPGRTPDLGATLNTTYEDGHDLRWTRRDNLLSYTSPTTALADTYKGTITAKPSADTITVDPALTTEIADDTPVFPDNSRPLDEAVDAAIANGGGVVELPTGDYDCRYLEADSSDWAQLPGAGPDVAILAFGTPDARIYFKGNNSNLRIRPGYIAGNLVGVDVTDAEQGNQYVVYIGALQQFTWDSLNVVMSPLSGSGAGWECGQDFCLMFSTLLGGGNAETIGTRLIKDSDFIIPSMGKITHQGDDNQSTRFVRNKHWYGGHGHTPGWNSGVFEHCRLEGVYQHSTGVYTDDEDEAATRLLFCELYEIATDGVRIRQRNFEMVGGKIETVHDQYFTTAFLFDSPAKNAKIKGVEVNTPGKEIRLVETSLVEGCFLRNTPINCSTRSRIIGNYITFNDWCRNFAGSAIQVDANNIMVEGNTIWCESTVTYNGSTTENVGNSIVDGIYLTGTATNITIGNNNVTASDQAIQVTSYTGDASFTGGYYYTYELINSFQYGSQFEASSGSRIELNGVRFDALSKSDAVTFRGVSTAQYSVEGCIFDCELEFNSGLTGINRIRDSQCRDATQSVDFLDAGTIIENVDFAVGPTLTGASLSTSGNRVAAALSVTPAALASGTTNDYALPATDQVRLDPNASNSTISSFVARADGCEVTIICTDAGAATLTILHDDGATGTAANRIVTPTAANIVLSNGERVVLKYDATLQRWYVIGGAYAMNWDSEFRSIAAETSERLAYSTPSHLDTARDRHYALAA